MSAEGIDPQIAGGEEEDPCGPTSVGKLGLRIGSLFIILASFPFPFFSPDRFLANLFNLPAGYFSYCHAIPSHH